MPLSGLLLVYYIKHLWEIYRLLAKNFTSWVKFIGNPDSRINVNVGSGYKSPNSMWVDHRWWLEVDRTLFQGEGLVPNSESIDFGERPY